MQSLGKLQAQAVGGGLSSPKALSLIADNTGQLVEQSSAMGIKSDTSGIISGLITGAVDKDDQNQEYALKKAIDAYKSNADIMSNTAVSMPSMVALQRLASDTGIDYESSLAAQKIPIEVIARWKKDADKGGASRTRVEEEMQAQGININDNKLWQEDSNKFLSTYYDDMVLKLVEGAGAGIGRGAGGAYAKLKEWAGADPKKLKFLTTGEGLKDMPKDIVDAKLAITHTAQALGRDPNAFMSSIFSLANGTTDYPNTLPFEGQAAAGIFGISQEEVDRGKEQQISAVRSPLSKILGEKFSGSTTIGSFALTGRAHQAAAGANAEEKFADASKNVNSLEDFAKSTVNLNSASTALLKASQVLIELVGKKTNLWDDETKKLLDKTMEKMPELDVENEKKQKADGGTE
jgi:hypothetical protein